MSMAGTGRPAPAQNCLWANVQRNWVVIDEIFTLRLVADHADIELLAIGRECEEDKW